MYLVAQPGGFFLCILIGISDELVRKVSSLSVTASMSLPKCDFLSTTIGNQTVMIKSIETKIASSVDHVSCIIQTAILNLHVHCLGVELASWA